LLRNAAGFETAAVSGATPSFADFLRRAPLPAGPSSGLRWVATEKSALHFPDLAAEADYQRHEPDWAAAMELEGARTGLHVPMLRGDDLIGILTMYRRVKRPFTKAQITLAQTFAGQAAIASENIRLLQDLQSRDRELSRALDRERATAVILDMITRSSTDIQPVLDAVAERAARLCDAPYANVMLVEGDQLQVVSAYLTESGPRPDQPKFAVRRAVNGRAVLDREITHPRRLPLMGTEFPDIQISRCSASAGARCPAHARNQAIGIFPSGASRNIPESGGAGQTFADQAVIAIESARLFSETKAALEQQTATPSRSLARRPAQQCSKQLRERRALFRASPSSSD
jgi:hypothetical protein